MGLFAPSRCVEVVSRCVGSLAHGCEMFGVQAGEAHTVKAARTRRNRMVGVGYAEKSPATSLRSPDYRAMIAQLRFLDDSHLSLLNAACAHLESTVLVEVERLIGIRAARIDAFLASLPVAA